jgi:AraC family transcriptional regulator, alkane utilization regulator
MKIDYADAVSDVLTTVLNALQFQGRVFCYTKLSAPWALRLKRKEFAHFHFFESGEGWVVLEDTGAEIPVSSGDLVVMPHGGGHLLRDANKTKAVNVEELLPCRDVLTLRHGGGGSETTTVCGAFTFENQIGNPILPLLPEIIHVSREKIQSAVWLEPMLQLLAHEAQNPREGSGSIIGHLTGIIFVQSVRAWIESQPQGQGGWLGALRDKQISAALTLMHQRPSEHWTIAKLASAVGMSRSPFATKFTSLIGEPPLAYLTKWRMNLAAGYLRDEQLSIRQIGERVGYESQASFTNAFKRNFSFSPREYKEKHKPMAPPLKPFASSSAAQSN